MIGKTKNKKAMNTPYIWIAPPLIGALIGYLTNYVAIRMLFRPLKPWHLFSIRIPMTPGVIPSKRHDLAINIGKMVGDHLLTSGDIAKALADESFQNQLRNLIDVKIAELLRKDLGPLPSLIPRNFQTYFRAWIKVGSRRALQHLHNHLDGKGFEESLRKLLAERVSDLLDRNLDDVVPEEMFDKLIAFIEKTATDLLSSSEVEEWLTAYLDRKLGETLEKGRTPSDLIPADLKNGLLDRLEKETPGMLGKLAGTIREPAMRDKIADTLTSAVEGFTSTLGPIAAMLGNFIKTETIKAKISEYLDSNGDQLAEWLVDENVQRRVSEVVREKTDKLLDTPLKDLLADVDQEKITAARSALAARITSFLKEPATITSITALLQESFKSWQRRDLKELTILLFGPKGAEMAKEKIGDEIINLIRSGNFKRMLDRLLYDLVDNRLLKSRIGRLEDLLPAKIKDGIGAFLLDQTNSILVKEVPDLIDSLNISEMVTRKVDSLDLLKLEGLLLSIMQEQFKYINLFGGLLGFIIGMMNLLFIVGS